ncbi:MAG TPA: TadE family protein [Candidatus Limnocylindrales bacterium]
MTPLPGRRDRLEGARLERGQSMVEFALILPAFILVLLGLLEFGSAYDHRNAMAYAVREGARVGASLGNGGTSSSTVDPTIVAAVRRGLTDPILIENIASIEIYKADSSGAPVTGKINKFDHTGAPVGTQGWPASSRVAGINGDMLGVRVVYDFRPTTPLGSMLALLINPNPPYSIIKMTDVLVMKLEPTP